MDRMKADVLVVDSQLLSFNLFIGMDVIKMLGGVSINKFSENISKMNPFICTAIKLEEPDFSTDFDYRTGLWKCSGDQPPNNLTNRIPEYPLSAHIWQEYQHELQMWLLCNLGPPNGLILLMVVLQQNKKRGVTHIELL